MIITHHELRIMNKHSKTYKYENSISSMYQVYFITANISFSYTIAIL